jgi:glycolate oxidase
MDEDVGVTHVTALAEALPDGAVVLDPEVIESYRYDNAGTVAAGTPTAVVHARSTDDVVVVMRWAQRHGVPVVPRGGGTGLAGGANAVDGSVVVSLAGMDEIVSIDVDDLYAVVQPGVVNADLGRAAARVGLYYPPDPASKESCTIGGNVATNAGGLCCLKYGVTSDSVLGLTVVLADGRVLRTGRRTAKGVAGYDLTRLFVGSEGTLGIVTEVVVRLRPAPKPAATLVAFFPELRAAADAVARISTSGVVPSMLELMDRTTIRVVDDALKMDLDRDAAALLLAQSDAGGDQAAEEIATMVAVCEKAGADFVAETTDPDEGESLLAARRGALPALERLGSVLLDDVCVPRTRVPDLVIRVEEIAARHDVLIGTFGHAGDGNMHPTVVFDSSDEASTRRAMAAFDDILAAALDLGGTITGEHGVGRLKRPALTRELDEVALDVHRAVKAAFDPAGILNPGVVIDG